MNKKILITILSLSLVSGGLVLAEGTSSTSSMQEKREGAKAQIEAAMKERKNALEAAKEKIDAIKEQLKNQREDTKNKIQERVEKRIETKKDKVLKNFTEAIKNLDNLLARVNSRISKIELGGINMSVQKALVASSTNAISIAKSEYSKLANLIPENITKEERKTILANIKDQSEKTKEAIKNAHASIVDIIKNLKVGLERHEWQDSTSTATTTED